MSDKEGTPYTSHTENMSTILPQIILNNEHLIVFCSDDAGKILFWNRAAEIITGYSHDEVPDVATILRAAYPDSNHRSIITNIRDSLREKKNKSVHYETKIKTKNGQIRYISWTIERIPETDKTPLMYVSTGADVTHSRQSERDALLLSEIVTSSYDAIVSISPDGSILTWNRSAEDIFGYGETESIGKSFSRHIPKEGQNFFASILKNISKGQHFRGNMVCLTKTGKKIITITTFSPISDEDGAVTGISVIMKNMTHELSLQNTMKGYISEATMRLNHPVELVEGNLTSLIERIKEDNLEEEEIVIELLVQVKALSQIIYNLRELSQAVIGHFKGTEDDMIPDTI